MRAVARRNNRCATIGAGDFRGSNLCRHTARADAAGAVGTGCRANYFRRDRFDDTDMLSAHIAARIRRIKPVNIGQNHQEIRTCDLRSMRRQRVYALINIVGLTIGIVSALLITTFVRYELSYESALEKSSQIYRVVRQEPG